jgi:hypothetical protein
LLIFALVTVIAIMDVAVAATQITGILEMETMAVIMGTKEIMVSILCKSLKFKLEAWLTDWIKNISKNQILNVIFAGFNIQSLT